MLSPLDGTYLQVEWSSICLITITSVYSAFLDTLEILCKNISGAEVTKPPGFTFLLTASMAKEQSVFPPCLSSSGPAKVQVEERIILRI